MKNEDFKIKENIELHMEVKVSEGRFSFEPILDDTGWTSYTLEKAGTVIAENVSYEGIEIYDEPKLLEWYQACHKEDYDFAIKNEFDLVLCAKEKLEGTIGSADSLYEREVIGAKEKALETWIEEEKPIVYRNDVRGFANEFELIFVLPGAKYEPDEKEYKVNPKDAVEQYFSYADDACTEDFSETTIIEANTKS
jgi:hypothetical protein